MVQGDEKLILLMGATGSGKSSYINSVVGEEVATVGHDLKSASSHVREYPWTSPSEHSVLLIDTPGFEDLDGTKGVGRTAVDVLRMIAAWMGTKYNEDKKLSGIIYLHDITQPCANRMMRRDMAAFKSLRGTGAMANVTVVTTFWDTLVSHDDGFTRERDLQGIDGNPDSNGLLKELHESGATFARSGLWASQEVEDELDLVEFPYPSEVVERLLREEPPVSAQAQQEAEEDVTVLDTSTGRTLQEEFDELRRECRESVDNLKSLVSGAMAEQEQLRARDESMELQLSNFKKELEGKAEGQRCWQTEFSDSTKAGIKALQSEHHADLDALRSLISEKLQTVNSEFALREAVYSQMIDIHTNLTKVITAERDEWMGEARELRADYRRLQDMYIATTSGTVRHSEVEKSQIKDAEVYQLRLDLAKAQMELKHSQARDKGEMDGQAQGLREQLKRATTELEALRTVNGRLEEDVRQARAETIAAIESEIEVSQELGKQLVHTQSSLTEMTLKLELLQEEHKKKCIELDAEVCKRVVLEDELAEIKGVHAEPASTFSPTPIRPSRIGFTPSDQAGLEAPTPDLHHCGESVKAEWTPWGSTRWEMPTPSVSPPHPGVPVTFPDPTTCSRGTSNIPNPHIYPEAHASRSGTPSFHCRQRGGENARQTGRNPPSAVPAYLAGIPVSTPRPSTPRSPAPAFPGEGWLGPYTAERNRVQT